MGDQIRGRIPRRIKQVAIVGLLGAAIASAGGCGSNSSSHAESSPAAATSTAQRTTAARATTVRYRTERALFQRTCSGCHTLADAGASGTGAGGEANFDQIRPNISSVENYLTHRIGKMPDFSHRLSKRQRTALATYVADVDGCGITSPTGCDP
jgi:mono/diheme cytochrome c family protein